MKSSYFKKLCCVALSIFGMFRVQGAGSLDTTLTGTDKSQFITVPWNFDPGAYASGFVYFANGFSIYPSNTLPIGINQPVARTIILNGGILSLQSDLFLGGDTVVIFGPGTIELNSFALIMSSPVTIVDDVQISGSGFIIGGGNEMVLDGTLDLSAIANTTISNLTFNNLFGTRIITAGNQHIIFDNVTFNVVGSSEFVLGTELFEAQGIVTFAGSGSTVQLNGRMLIDQFSTVYFAEGVSLLNVGTSINGTGITFTDPTSSLIFDNATFIQNGPLVQFFSGRTLIEGNSSFKSLNDSYLQMGDGLTTTNDHELVIFSGSTLTLSENFLLKYQNFK